MDVYIQIARMTMDQFAAGTLTLLILAFAMFAGNTVLLLRYMPPKRESDSIGESQFANPFPWFVGSLLAVTLSLVAGAIVLGYLPRISGTIMHSVIDRGGQDPLSVSGPEAGRVPATIFWSVVQHLSFVVAVISPAAYFAKAFVDRVRETERLYVSQVRATRTDNSDEGHSQA